MALTFPAHQLWQHLCFNPDAYLFGIRDADTPLSVISPNTDNGTNVEWMLPVPRSIADELWKAGYLRDDAECNPSELITLFASENVVRQS